MDTMMHSSIPDILWHGTTEHTARIIAKTGILGSPKNGVFLSKDRDIALHFAMDASLKSHEMGFPTKPVLIAVPSHHINPNVLKSDIIMMCAPVRRPIVLDQIKNSNGFRDFSQSADTFTWQESLDKSSTVFSPVPILMDSVSIDTSIENIPPFLSAQDVQKSETQAKWPHDAILAPAPNMSLFASPKEYQAHVVFCQTDDGPQALKTVWADVLASMTNTPKKQITILDHGLLIKNPSQKETELVPLLKRLLHSSDAPIVATHVCEQTHMIVGHIAKPHTIIFHVGNKNHHKGFSPTECVLLFLSEKILINPNKISTLLTYAETTNPSRAQPNTTPLHTAARLDANPALVDD